MSLVLDIALTHVRGRLRQTLVSVAGIALGVGFSIAMASLMVGSQRDFLATLVDAIPHVQMTDETRRPAPQPAETLFAAVEYRGLTPEQDQRGIRDATEVVTVLGGLVPGVVSAGLAGQAVVRYAGRDVGVTVTGVVPEREAKIARKVVDGMKAGSFQAIGEGQAGIVLGRGVAEKVGASYGDTITIATSRGLVKRFKIVGVYRTGVSAVDDATAYVALKSAQVLFARPNAVNTIKVRLPDPMEAEGVARRMESAVGYKAVSWQESNGDLMSAFQIRNVIMYTVVGAILLVAGFGIYNVISTIVHEKARDIAILKSLGFAEADMRRIFLIEGLLMGLMGAAFGCVLGWLLTLALGQIKFELRGVTEVTRLPLYLHWSQFALASLFALASAGVAGYLPARKAAKVKPVDIIRGAT